ncbi:hypothetical protein H112_03540 [Trichophyton rubrum D6]|uniref:SAM and PH domain-containing protein n=2 Tax=Trichophyton rubrum TaxID=5551 RepID=A0A178EZ61_TRIRU|nr:hypothetical protein H102_03538 [Trichophyton rubrum CBS 100081]EZF53569.1 hypothetical protein H103_03549 [Trichophyton rubrum CBS 288.86]EZF64158.1 hypothetical protein H104_03535 [Trichophyton rubrum CBS 289.86]EZF85435.1 hypothetical protein H110_03546 [Trichophyton rubrum MR1448]EZF96213.1 hypothetical protein H113_03567 [Trichophyton rubrum MR1459]EZG07239.1 hypothetical protein H106_03356 [Trichophyton rubrum CBS 735.88]EZG17833.1 hypothetical protein H107_03655 [Trichophyton rubrum
MDYTYIPPLSQGNIQMFPPVNNNQAIDYMMRRSSFNSRPLSEATEIQDLDYEVEYFEPESPRRSIESFGTDSATTLSLSDEPPTPGPYEARTFELPSSRNLSKPVQGPSGPHLFRGSMDSTMLEKPAVEEWQLSMSPVSLEDIKVPMWAPQERRSSEPAQIPEIPRTSSRISHQKHNNPSFVQNWTPTQVAEWMYEVGVEDSLVERFIQNDISGAVLLDLHIDDLKELDIQSFGKRHYLMNMIQTLRNATDPNSIPELARVNSSMSNTPPLGKVDSPECTTSASPDGGARHDPPAPKRRGRRNRVISEEDIISPAESVSIVAIEQLLPKPHKCSKGENCSKYQKRQRKLARIAKQFPNEFALIDGELVATTNQVVPPTPAMTQISRKSDAAPSLVASSDVLGPGLLPDLHPELQLNAENLNGVRPRDPQENVRQFLTFQHMHSPDLNSALTNQPLEMFPPLPSQEQPVHVSNQLRSLPKLTIPNQTLSVSDPASALRTVTPSMGARVVNSPTATQEYNPYAFDGNNTFRHGTPFSEMDVPITAVPVEPLAREASQSVPPGMRYGNIPTRQHQTPEPPVRSRSTRPERHRRHPSVNTMTPLHEIESLSPIENPSDMDAATKPQPPVTQQPGFTGSSSSSSAQKDPDVTHSGWMKKRRTTRLLRHEWQDAHFTLKGTILAMHKDEFDTHRHSRALESIDVDDYAVACSSLASNSKLTAAFKRSVLRKAANLNNNSYKGMDETAFAFSLIPATKPTERKSIFTANGKNHHFAVKTRDERINWMRELMLAKALKKGKEAGNEIKMNGNFI